MKQRDTGLNVHGLFLDRPLRKLAAGLSHACKKAAVGNARLPGSRYRHQVDLQAWQLEPCKSIVIAAQSSLTGMLKGTTTTHGKTRADLLSLCC